MGSRLQWFVISMMAITIAHWTTMAARSAPQADAPAYQTDFPPEEFKARWSKIYDRIGDRAIAVVQGVGMTPGFIVPRQNNEFYYLSGIETPGAYIMLDGRNRTATLYLPRRNARLEAAEGRVLSADDSDLVKRLTGIDNVSPVENMKENWPPGGGRVVIFTPFAPAENYAMSRGEAAGAIRAQVADYWDQRPSDEMNFVHLLQSRLNMEVRDLTPILDELRGVKSPREIDLIRRASQIAALGLVEAMKATQPGVYEYHLDAAARYVFLANGARLDGYRSITAAGMTNIVNIHYFRNTSELKDGDLVLMDYAPDFRYYTSDIGRMWPVNGTFNPEQRALLGFILEYRNAIISRIRPGVTSQQVMEEARTAMESVFARWKFVRPEHEQAARELVRTGGGVFSHPVGMAVHDAGGRPNPLRPGQVFSIDPQLRMRDASGQTVLYMRYEDVGVVTETGFENFTAFMPTTLEEIERTVRLKGIIQDYPPNSMPWKIGSQTTGSPLPPPQPAAEQRTEAEARRVAERNRAERDRRRLAEGAPVELIPNYIRAQIGPVPSSLGVSPFYKKYVDAQGIPVISSERVPDDALLVARDIIISMLSARPDIRKKMIERSWRTGVIAETEMTADIPEYANRKRPGAPSNEPVNQADRDYHAWRSRGLGGNPTTGAEENLLGYPGTRYYGEHIFVHEFAHAIMSSLRQIEPETGRAIQAAYDEAKAAAKYILASTGRPHYALTDPNEYWAEGVQWWFFSNYGECFKGNIKVDTPDEFKAYDSKLYELIGRVFDTHRIPMDVFHGKQVRKVVCP